jgi:hypothetical protein
MKKAPGENREPFVVTGWLALDERPRFLLELLKIRPNLLG